jgi:hypothetical protein
LLYCQRHVISFNLTRGEVVGIKDPQLLDDDLAFSKVNAV